MLDKIQNLRHGILAQPLAALETHFGGKHLRAGSYPTGLETVLGLEPIRGIYASTGASGSVCGFALFRCSRIGL
ncbi:MAG: hypothetical protein WAN01_21050, partial [Bradyrhizobium sp.]